MLHKITFSCQQCGTIERLVIAEDQVPRPLCKHCLPEGERATGTVLRRASRTTSTEPGIPQADPAPG